MAKHLPYGGSTIERAMLCRASARASENAPKMPSGVYAKEGTLAHEVLERALREGLTDVTFLVGFDGITDKMADAVNMALEYIRDVTRPGDIVVSEKFVSYAPFAEIAGGTADVQIIREHNGGSNEVIDFKFGYDPVEAYAPQMPFYGICAMGTDRGFICTVIQPNAFHPDGPIRSCEWSPDELKAFEEAVILTIEEAEAAFAPYTPSVKACHNCAAASGCAALEQAALSLPALRNVQAISRGKGVLPAPETLTIERAAQIVSKADILTEWLKSVEEWLFVQVMSGANAPGFKLVEKSSRRSWSSLRTVDQTAKILAETSGLPPEKFIRRELKPITEVQAEVKRALVDTGVKAKDAGSLAKSVMAYVVDKPRSPDVTLVPSSDPRETVNRAARDFAGVSFRSDNNG